MAIVRALAMHPEVMLFDEVTAALDPEREKILVYDFTSDFEAFIYGLDDEIPVRIYDGDLVIDMKQIREEIEALKDLKE